MPPGTSNGSDEILRAIQEVMHDMFELDAARVLPEARLVEDLSLDSIDAIDLALKLEEVSGLVFDEAKLRQMRTIGDIIAAIQAVAPDARRGKAIHA
jgi:acyl carrier protein